MSRTTAESRSAVCCGSFLAEKRMRAAAARELSSVRLFCYFHTHEIQARSAR